jgi:catechol 2,3-dioxygenase-like lactoylglutathione lyase family enzyme
MSSSTQISDERTKDTAASQIDMKLEVVVIPVSDIDRAKRFYAGLGWRLDADIVSGDGSRVVQLTPAGSPCSIHLRQRTDGSTAVSAGTWLIVSDIDAARSELLAHGAQVTGVFHFAQGQRGPVPGRDPDGHSYASFVSFNDPDGNSWLLQEVNTRIPGRGFTPDVASMADALEEAEKYHGQFEPTAPKHHWSDWYAAFIVARERGKTIEEASREGALNVGRVLGKPV